MTWPTPDVDTTDMDAGTDSPSTARADLLDLAQKFNQMRNHVSAFIQGLLDDASDSVARATLGASAVGDAVFVSANAAAARAAIFPSAPNFRATYGSNLTLTGSNQVVPFDTEGEDVGGNHLNGVFTAPVAGLYLFTYGLEYAAISPTSINVILSSLQVNGSDVSGAGTRTNGPSNANPDCVAASIFITLAANDTVKVVARYGNLAATSLQVCGTANSGFRCTYFSGALIR